MPSKTLDKNEVIHGLIDVRRQDAIVLLEAGYFLMQLGKKKEAKDIFSGAIALFPHSDVPCIALGNLYLVEGKPDLAIKEHQRALQRVPTSSAAQAHIGEALLFQKKIPEGVQALKKAIEMEPNGPSSKLAKELLRANDLHVFDAA
ncbi:MAG: tetratricopeptide repeat protein [Myxococcota bacterium]